MHGRSLQACERVYGLNRPELLRLRFTHYETYMGSVLVVESPGVSEVLHRVHRSLIASYTEADSEYAGMVRYFEARREAGDRLPLPSFD